MTTREFRMEEFVEEEETTPSEILELEREEKSNEDETSVEETDVLKEVVESLSVDKAQLIEELESLRKKTAFLEDTLQKVQTERDKAKTENVRLEKMIGEIQSREYDAQERNPNALALLDRDTELPDRFPGESRDHVLEVISEARTKAEMEGCVRKAQILESVLVANEPNGTLAKKRSELQNIFAENANILSGPVLEKLKKLGISHKKGEDYLLPAEILKRTY